MCKQNQNSVNFNLIGSASIQVGIYFMLAAYLIQTIINGFLIDDNPAGMLSVEIIEVISLTIVILTFLFSGLALYFKGKRKSKKNNLILWNKNTKQQFWFVLIGFWGILISFIILTNSGEINFITPVFLAVYGLLIFLLKNKQRKNIIAIAGISILLAIITLLIPTYWYSSIFILGIAHMTYGIMVKN